MLTFPCLQARALTGLILVAGFARTSAAQESAASRGPERWENAIAKFEAADRESSPPKGAILLVGGSNARRWTEVGRYFPGETVINRGFGGGQLADVLYFTDRIVLPYAPRTIILNAGGNDLSAGKSPDQVRDACRAFVQKVHATLPATKIYAVAIPITLRASQSKPEALAVVRRTNALLKELAATSRQFVFVDIVDAFLDPQGKPRPELFVEDGIHFTAKGQQILADLLHAEMKK